MRRKKRKQHVLMLLIAVTWLGLAGTVTPVRSQDLACCGQAIFADGSWFGMRRDCKAALEELSATSRAKACEQYRKLNPRPWFRPFVSSASQVGCCLEADDVCGAIPPRCKGDRPTLPTKANCEDGSVTPTISIELAETLNIDESPEMPKITATATVTPSTSDINWEAQITYKLRNCANTPAPNLNSSKVTGQGETFTPDFGAIYGGKLEIKAKTNCGQGAETTITREVGGLNADPTEVRNEIGTMNALFEADDLKQIACHESQQKHYTSSNKLTLGATDDVGIMQICYQRSLGDVWNWKTNIATARNRLLEAAAFSRGVPRAVRTRIVRSQGPFPNATNFTNAELRLEAIKRYNAGNTPNVGYWEWDDAAGAWVANPQGGGDPNYVANVIRQNANCPR